MQELREQLRKDKANLDMNILDIAGVIYSENVAIIAEDHLHLMCQQLFAMMDYSEALRKRIDLLLLL